MASLGLRAAAQDSIIRLPEQNQKISSSTGNIVLPDLKTYYPQRQMTVTYPARNPQTLQNVAAPSVNLILAKLTGSFDDAFNQVINILSQRDFEVLSFDIQKGFIVAQDTINGDKIFSVLGTYDNQCFVKISCLSKPCYAMNKFSGVNLIR